MCGVAHRQPEPRRRFRVEGVTNSFSAEYGQTSGSVMLANTKSGTNEFHGTLFEFLRNDKLNAGNYYTARRTFCAITSSVAVWAGQSSAIRHSSSVGSRSHVKEEPPCSTTTVPIDAFRHGDFSSILGAQLGTDALGRPVYRNQIFDPATQRTARMPRARTLSCETRSRTTSSRRTVSAPPR